MSELIVQLYIYFIYLILQYCTPNLLSFSIVVLLRQVSNQWKLQESFSLRRELKIKTQVVYGRRPKKKKTKTQKSWIVGIRFSLQFSSVFCRSNGVWCKNNDLEMSLLMSATMWVWKFTCPGPQWAWRVELGNSNNHGGGPLGHSGRLKVTFGLVSQGEGLPTAETTSLDETVSVRCWHDSWLKK